MVLYHGDNFQLLLDLACRFRPDDLFIRNRPLLEPLDSGLNERGSAGSDARHCTLHDLLLILFRHQKVALRCDEIRAVNCEKRLSLSNILIGCIRKRLLDVARESDLDVGQPGFVHCDVAGRPNLVCDELVLHLASCDANTL